MTDRTVLKFNYKVQVSEDMSRRVMDAVAVAQYALDAQIEKSMQPFTPFLSGELQSSLKGLGTGKLTYGVSYDRYQYYGLGFNYTKDHHPNAGSMWFERAKELYKDQWVGVAQKTVDEYLWEHRGPL